MAYSPLGRQPAAGHEGLPQAGAHQGPALRWTAWATSLGKQPGQTAWGNQLQQGVAWAASLSSMPTFMPLGHSLGHVPLGWPQLDNQPGAVCPPVPMPTRTRGQPRGRQPGVRQPVIHCPGQGRAAG
ncbi:hypothetical protein HaLaN_10063 [Haematococcus lacustris]|uniref:Uncharacterized protein n=1 Tax=Haematococcus lacustris TaxID=44745 RepID=A0A699YWV2_HAELA|nr:hypothetical protein HaLaN_10063 [Haematococcus lacustris]